MDRLFSPWRSEHVANMTKPAYQAGTRRVFTEIGENDADEENLVLWRGEHVFVVLNLFPYTNGHMMVVPFRQVARYDELNAEELLEMSVTTQHCIMWLRKTLAPDGFNIGLNQGSSAGAGIPDHLHMHVVPRWSGDTNFTSTVGNYRVVPEDLKVTYKRISEAVAELPVVVPGF